MVQHPEVDLVSICVRVPFHHQLGMAALNAGKHLYCEWPLAATTEQAQQMRDLADRKGVHPMVGLQARGTREFNRVRDLVAEGYVGKVLSCTMIIATTRQSKNVNVPIECAHPIGTSPCACRPILMLLSRASRSTFQ